MFEFKLQCLRKCLPKSDALSVPRAISKSATGFHAAQNQRGFLVINLNMQAAAPYPSPAAADEQGGVPTGQFANLSVHGGGGGNEQQQQQERVVCGPLLRYIGIDYARRIYQGSCLVVSNHRYPPSFEIELTSANDSSNHQPVNMHVQGQLLDVFRHEYHFWRYEIQLPLREEPQTAVYTVVGKTFKFHLPGYLQNMRFMFYSCNGFSDVAQEVKDKFGNKDAPLWQDVLDRHEVVPFHVLLGGGDQLYQDRVIKEEFMKPWLEEKDPKKRLAMELTPKMKQGFEHFFFWNYVQNFGFDENPWVACAFASIPSVNMWDDHDIIDGYGSYPAEMQKADCFKVLFANACRFYYLFQQHTTMKLASSHGMLPGAIPTCNHIVTTLGPDIGLVALDCRGERTKYDICRPRSYDVVFNAIYQNLPPTVRHLLIVTGVPLIYPRLSLFESAMESAATFNLATIAGKTGALGDVVSGSLNKWNGDPELLDDMNDHWTAGNHEVERKKFIQKLQLYAREKSVRVSFLAGDVHCCAAGRLFSKDQKEKEEGDPFLMVQIISSAIINVPPPQALLTILNQNSTYITFNGNVEERMYNIFKKSPNGNTRQNKKLMGMRNYCAGYYDESTGKMNFWIQVEKVVGQKGTVGYLLDVPRLVFGQAGLRLWHMDKRQALQQWTHPPVQQHSTHSHQHHHPPSSGHQHHIGGFAVPSMPHPFHHHRDNNT